MGKKHVLRVAQANDFVSKWNSNSRNFNPKQLEKYTSIEDSAAAILGQSRVYRLSLGGVTELSAIAARGLSQHKQRCLNLGSLTQLSDEAAEALSRYKGAELYLDGLTDLSDRAAEALGRCKAHHLNLNGLKTLSAKAALGLSNFHGGYTLLGLTEFSGQAAKALASFSGTGLALGLKQLSLEVARAIPKFKVKKLSLCLVELPPEQAAELRKFKGEELWLTWLPEISDQAAQELAKFNGELHLSLKANPSNHAAQALRRFHSPVNTSGPQETKAKKKSSLTQGVTKTKTQRSSSKSNKKPKTHTKTSGNLVRQLKLSFWIDAVVFPEPAASLTLPSVVVEAKKSYEKNPKVAQKQHSKALESFLKSTLILDSIDGSDALFDPVSEIPASEVKLSGFVFDSSALPSCAVHAVFKVPIRNDDALLEMSPEEWYDLLDDRGIGFALSVAWSMTLPDGEEWWESSDGHQGFEWEVTE